MQNHFFAALEARRTPPEAVFLRPRLASRDRCWTYADVDRRSARMAHALRACGVLPGDRVMAQIEKSPEGLMLYLGALRVGAVFLPLNTAYTVGELGYFLTDAAPRLVVCAPERLHANGAAVAANAGARVETLSAEAGGSLMALADAQPESFDDEPRAGNDLAAILYTSGTTGRSKGAMLTHGNLVSNAQVLVEAWRFDAADRLLHALPTYHTHGLFTALNTVLFAGASMIMLPRYDTAAVVAELPRATAMMGVPTFYTRLLAHPGFDAAATGGIRLFTSGSAPLLAETHREWAARTGHAILERYGMTETNMTTSNPYDGERRPGTVGFALSDVSLRVVDPDTGAPLAQGDVGAIEVKGPNVFQGYWRNPEKTAAEFRPDGFFITGDLGRLDEDGYLHIVGRGKDLIITGGFNVYPKEVETEIDGIDGVVESAVIGLPDADLGESVAAVVVLRPGVEIDGPAIEAALAGRLARFKLPKHVFAVGDLPRNAMGKVQKAVLRETYGTTSLR